MSHEIFGSRFASFNVPAWHHIGIVFDTPMSAQDAFSKMGGYDITLEDLAIPDGTRIPARAIMREAVPDDPERRYFGIAGPDYHLLSPLAICTLWDQKVKAPLETIGAIYKGETLFLSSKLQNIDVNGDEIESYMLLRSPYGGGKAYTLHVTPIRVVCRNTLVAGIAAATHSWKICHDATAEKKLGDWLESIEVIARRKAEALRQMFQMFAARHVNKSDVCGILDRTYTPKIDASTEHTDYMPKSLADALFEKARTERALLETRKAAAIEMFDGRMTGPSVATRGTVWGIYNAVVELEDSRRGRDLQSRATDALFGLRAQAKARCYDACVDVVTDAPSSTRG